MYRLRTPADPLAPYVEHYWFVTHAPEEEVNLRVDVFVDARADLIFNFEDPYHRDVVGGGGSALLKRSNIDAQRLVPIRIRQRGFVRIAGVRFRLGGLAPFARDPLTRWSGLTPAPREVLGDKARTLERELRDCTDFDASARMLDAFFLAHLRIDAAQSTFERILAEIVNSGGRTTAGRLAELSEVSSRQVERIFARRLGFPPQTIGRVVRFQTALRRLMSDPGVPLGDVAADAGYYDQAHFVRDFRSFTGGVPRGYRGYYPRSGPSDFSPNVVAYVQDDTPDALAD